MDISRRIGHLGLALLLGYLLLALGLAYWQAVRAGALVVDQRVSAERTQVRAQRVTRGRILDRNGEVLAETLTAADGTRSRVYTSPGAVHAVGFRSIRFGAAGAEAAGDDVLSGRAGGGPETTLRELLHLPVYGGDVRLTLDGGLQAAAEAAMAGAPGAAVALNPRTGELLALVSNPGFDGASVEEQWEQLRARPDSPLLNRVTQGLYTPGSTFKTVTLAAALEAGLLTADTAAECPARIEVIGHPVVSNNEPPGKRTRTVADAFAYSCNTFFAQLGVALGPERLTAMVEALGLLEAAPFELPTVEGRLQRTADFLEDDRGLAVTAFGQGELLLTPLQLALIAAAVANDGLVPTPRLIADDVPAVSRRAMSSRTAQTLAAIMEYSVQEGWAQTAAIPGVRIAGKTGSAELGEGESSHAVFIAFAPVEDPQVAVAVLKERAGAGSREAGPVARAIIAAALGLAPD